MNWFARWLNGPTREETETRERAEEAAENRAVARMRAELEAAWAADHPTARADLQAAYDREPGPDREASSPPGWGAVGRWPGRNSFPEYEVAGGEPKQETGGYRQAETGGPVSAGPGETVRISGQAIGPSARTYEGEIPLPPQAPRRAGRERGDDGAAFSAGVIGIDSQISMENCATGPGASVRNGEIVAGDVTTSAEFGGGTPQAEMEAGS